MANINIINQINEIILNVDYEMLRKETMDYICKLNVELQMVEHMYKDKELDDLEEFINVMKQLKDKKRELVEYVNKANEIEMHAIGMRNTEMMYKCENLKANSIYLMDKIGLVFGV
jgi:uncharacterized protein YacL (UPF0231 family)